MRFFFPVVAAACMVVAAVPVQAARVHRGPTSGKHHSTKPATKAAAPHQRAIDDARATQIQTALVKAGYLKEASGHWDSTSEAAMQKMQADNGWQTKIIPDSRALIKLGLGPNNQPAPAQAAVTSGTSAAPEMDAQGGK
jgi:hypothetical protein